jgi:hypothetical protein
MDCTAKLLHKRHSHVCCGQAKLCTNLFLATLFGLQASKFCCYSPVSLPTRLHGFGGRAGKPHTGSFDLDSGDLINLPDIISSRPCEDCSWTVNL